MTRRILTIILAIGLAVVGTGAVLLYVKGADQRVLNGQKAVTVLVADQQVPAGIKAGTALSEGLLRHQKLPAASVPSDAVRVITPGLNSLVLSADLPSGQLLLRPMLVTALAAHTGLAIPPGMVALSLQFCLPRDVAGYVQPGSEVAVFNTFVTVKQGGSPPTRSCDGINASQGVTGVHTRLVMPKVKVLAVGQASAAPATAGSTATSTAFSQNSSTSQSSNTIIMLVTVAANQVDAEKLIHLDEVEVPYLALVTPSSNVKPDIKFQP